MTPHKNPEGLVTWFEHPEPCGKTLIYKFVQDCGFANQLFELASAYGIAKRTGCHLRWSWEPSRLRKFELEAVGFAHTRHEGTPVVAEKVGQGNIRIVRGMERRINQTELPIMAISCPFQDEKCFTEDTTLVDEYYRPNLTPLPLDVPKGKTPVGVQVRRTDYVGHSRLDVVTPAYFRNGMEWMRDMLEGEPHFFIVSDDPQWCRHRFGNMPDVTVMPPQGSVEGMRTLVACDAHIISNSTFGWWGAWLGEKGPVVVPERWHHMPGSYGDWNIVPERWHPVSVAAEHEVVPVPLAEHEVMGPQHERAVVIPWKQDSGVWQELRYCLRSIDKYFADKECPIYILGTVRPPWLIHDQDRVIFRTIHSYRDALVHGLQIADKVAWFNDDTLLVGPTSWEDLETTLYLRDIGPDFLKKAKPQNNPWRAGCIHVLKELQRRGITKQRVFSTHTPYLFEREKAVAVMREFGVWEKVPFELAYFHLHPGRKQAQADQHRTQNEDFTDMRFLNFTDALLTKELKEAIENEFPEFAPWEVVAKF